MANINTQFLCAIVDILEKGLSKEHTYEAIFMLLERTVPFDSASFFLYDENRDQLELKHHHGEHIVELAAEVPFRRGFGLSDWVSRQKKPIIIESLLKARPAREGRFSSYVSMPLWSSNILIGVLNLGHKAPGFFNHKDGGNFEFLAAQVSLVLQRILPHHDLESQNSALQHAIGELERAQTQIIERERLAAINDLMVTLNHEINNPLASIIGLTEILELSFTMANPAKIREVIKSIHTEAKRIHRITERLSQIESLESQVYFGDTHMIKIPE